MMAKLTMKIFCTVFRIDHESIRIKIISGDLLRYLSLFTLIDPLITIDLDGKYRQSLEDNSLGQEITQITLGKSTWRYFSKK